jgi:hypothetical protein
MMRIGILIALIQWRFGLRIMNWIIYSIENLILAFFVYSLPGIITFK